MVEKTVEELRACARLLLELAKRRWTYFQVAIDSLSWIGGLFGTLTIRYDFATGWAETRELLTFLPLVLMAQFWIGLLIGLYRNQWRFGSFEEVRALVATAFLAAVLLTTIDVFFLERIVPASLPGGAAIIALVGMMSTRYLWRLLAERYQRPDAATAKRTIVIGAGAGGTQVVTALLRDRQSPFLPVAILDDHPSKANLRIIGVPVIGTTQHLETAVSRTGAEFVIIAIPSASGALIRSLAERCREAGIAVRVLPPVRDLLEDVGAGDLREPTEEDLLGRHVVETDVDSIASYITGQRVLVTGAGGSIGSELCRQLTRFAPSDLVMLDRDESALHGVELSIEGRALLNRPNLVVADIRDAARVHEVFEQWEPDVVFHAAALKHLPLLEMHPTEAVKTNVVGTCNVLDAAFAVGVKRFVNISTDKAADPVNVLGFSKRIAERLTADVAARAGGTYLSVRFGNVLGSRGSVLVAFRAQVEAGGPITVTDPDVTRYFMTTEEAVQLVIQGGAIGRSGEALVLDMGEPVRIADVAAHLAAQAAVPVNVVYTGLRAGEKLHEVLWGAGERDERPVHPLISHVAVPAIDRDAVASLPVGGSRASCIAALAEVAIAPAGLSSRS